MSEDCGLESKLKDMSLKNKKLKINKIYEMSSNNRYSDRRILSELNKYYDILNKINKDKLNNFIKRVKYNNDDYYEDYDYNDFHNNEENLLILERRYNIIDKLIDENQEFEVLIEYINNTIEFDECCSSFKLLTCNKYHQGGFMFNCYHNNFINCRYCKNSYCMSCIKDGQDNLVCIYCSSFICPNCIENNECNCDLNDKKIYKNLLKNIQNDDIYSDEDIDMNYQPSLYSCDSDGDIKNISEESDTSYDSGSTSSDPSYSEFFE